MPLSQRTAKLYVDGARVRVLRAITSLRSDRDDLYSASRAGTQREHVSRAHDCVCSALAALVEANEHLMRAQGFLP